EGRKRSPRPWSGCAPMPPPSSPARRSRWTAASPPDSLRGVTLSIARESPRQPEIVRLVEELDEYLGSLYPAESNHLLDVETLAQPDVRFFVGRRDGEALGCSALRVDPAGWGEVKRLYVSPRARGLGLGRQLLDALEAQARRERVPPPPAARTLHPTPARATL